MIQKLKHLNITHNIKTQKMNHSKCDYKKMIRTCYRDHVLKYVFISVIVIVPIIAILTFTQSNFFKRQKLKFQTMLYNDPRMSRLFATENHTFEYDAYILHEDSDEEIYEEIWQILENRKFSENTREIPRKYSVTNRDQFTVGNNESSRNDVFMEQSARIVFLVSENFFRDDFCLLSMNTAITAKDFQKKIIIVKLENPLEIPELPNYENINVFMRTHLSIGKFFFPGVGVKRELQSSETSKNLS